MSRRFSDRIEAGRLLAARLASYAGRADLLVLGLPRGGVPVAYQVALALGAPLDIMLVRKLGAPGHPELALGAIATGGVRVLNDEIVAELAVPDATIDAIALAEQRELERRARAYRGDRPAPALAGRTVILVDDGLATGATMHAAVRAARQQHPAAVVVAVPVAARASLDLLRLDVDAIVALSVPDPFSAVGAWYIDFEPTTDQEVRALLALARRRASSAGDTAEGRSRSAISKS